MKVKVKNIEELESRIAAHVDGKLEIVLEPGIYWLKNTLEIKNKKNIKLVGQDGARLVGGKKVSAKRVTDIEILSRIDEDKRDMIYVIDLRENGIPDDDVLIDCEHAIGLSVDGAAMHVSQYPKRSKYIHITDYINFEDPEIDDGWGKKYGIKKDGIVFNDTRVRAWKDPKSLYTYGFWVYDWETSRCKVSELDTEKMIVKTDPKDDRLSYFRVGQRMFFYNILEEVNEPASFFIDDIERKIYFMPPSGSTADEVIITTLKTDVINIRNSQNISLENIIIESSELDGIKSYDSDDITVYRCEVQNLRGHGIVLHDGYRLAVRGCSIHDLGYMGVSVDSGDRDTLTPGDSIIENNHVYRVARWQLCYAGGMFLGGVGNTLRNNVIHDHPHTAIFYAGNDLIIEHNEMYNLIQDTGDSGAIYNGRNYTMRGNIVRENFIHHLGGVGIGAMGIYNDDCLSGTIMVGNVFQSVPRACTLGGGRDLYAGGNVFLSCHPAIELDSRGELDLAIWRGIMRDLSDDVEAKLRKFPIYVEKYPETQDILDFFNAEECLPHIHSSAIVENNVFCDSTNFIFNMGGISADLEMRNNLEVEFGNFTDYEKCNFDLPADNLACKRGFKNIDMSKIGIKPGECRSELKDVYSCFVATPDELLFKMYNRGDEDTEVSYTFTTDVPGLDLSAYAFTDTLKAGESKTVVLPMSKDLYEQVPNGVYDLKRINGLYKVCAYSPIPGVRPAEIISKKEIFKYGV